MSRLFTVNGSNSIQNCMYVSVVFDECCFSKKTLCFEKAVNLRVRYFRYGQEALIMVGKKGFLRGNGSQLMIEVAL